jgi:salicylate hydroxylase
MQDGPEQESRDTIFLSQLGKDIVGEFPSRWYVSLVYQSYAYLF